MRRYVIILFFLASCRAAKPVQQSLTVKDSVVTKTEVRYRDTVIQIPGKNIAIHDTVKDCPDAVLNISGHKDGLTARATLIKGRIDVRCEADSLRLVIQFLQERLSFTERFKSEIKTIEKPVEVIKYRIPKWLLWVLLISLAVNAWHYRHSIFNGFGWLIEKGARLLK